MKAENKKVDRHMFCFRLAVHSIAVAVLYYMPIPKYESTH